MKTQVFDIAPGVRLHAIKTEKFKTNYLSFNFINSLSRETASLYSLLSKVLYRGTKTWNSTEELSKRLDYLYASSASTRIMKRGDAQYISFSSNMLKDKYVPKDSDLLFNTYNVLEEIMFKPYLKDGLLCEEYVETEKKNLIHEINSVINSKGAYSKVKCLEAMCAEELYSIPVNGTADRVAAISLSELTSAHSRFINESQIEIYFIGDTDTEKLVDRIKETFKDIKRTPLVIPETEVIRKARTLKCIEEKMSVAQGKLVMGFRTGKVLSDGDFHKFSVFAEIYGGGQSSKLFMNVRERLSLCYYCSLASLSQKGIMLVLSGIESDNREKAQNEILHQLESIKEKNISDEELENAKKSLTADLNSTGDSQVAIELWCISRYSNGLDDSIEEEIKRINSVNKDDVAECASLVTADTFYFLKGNGKGEGEDDFE